MITTRLKGGLGNQMFQYALGRHLAIKKGTTLKLDISDLIGTNEHLESTIRNYELNNFNIIEKISSDDEVFFTRQNKNKFLKIFKKIIPYHLRSVVCEKNLLYDEKILNIDGNINNKYLIGYWQTELYFKEIRDQLLKDFSPKNEISDVVIKISNKIKEGESVSLHIRRGDYVNRYSNLYYVQNVDYYLNALELIKNTHPNCKVFVFSDDIQWCESNLNFKTETYFVKPNKSFEDIYLMSLCKHNVIANSSFSWWGAWLNNNPDKICIAPKYWFKDKSKKNNIIPKEWVIL
ncbi:alpha-1,2-fucosyltransferase [Flavobacterium sp. XS2P39]|uniref:alpha-1,2-fucosyltransferase n=1 Tax=Flavobacterium sp. XS2P39 TaxID=3401725 RepID=UPI003AB037E0